ncbi:hypothetical protein QA612_06125 [Evansella sp. AB-P1]|nr:hypothetical protein [Evansella sp. AB-P1]MDG5787063.1 hypothetical protein [Evansella sp. AB-P1]
MPEHNLNDQQQRQLPIFGPFLGGGAGLFGFPFGLGGAFGTPGLPTMPPPTGMPGQPPWGAPTAPPFGPPGQGPIGGPPTAPPPASIPTPSSNVGVMAVDPGAIRRCMYRYTYVWLINRQQFWFYPVYVGRRSIAGYRWNGFSWVYFGIDLRQISSFQCY